MKRVMLIVLSTTCALPVLGQYAKPAIKMEMPPQCTITIYYCACTDGGDFSVDSGQVVVPEQLRQSYIDALSKMAKLYGTREQIAKRVARNGYQATSLRAASVAAWDSLFTPPKQINNVSISEDDDREIQGSYWHRRYRITGFIVGIDSPYPIFKIRRAIRISDGQY